MKKKSSACPAEDCSATNPIIYDQAFDTLPPEVQQALTKRQLDNEAIKRCDYCGLV
jgi:hypothetical protein